MCRDMKNYYSRKERNICVQCGGEKPEGRTYCDKCVEQIIERNNIRMNSRRASGQCIRCGDTLQEKDRLKNGKMAKQCKWCRDLRRKLRKERGWK